MLRCWLQFKRWIRALLIALSTEQPIDWTKEASKLGRIVQAAEDSGQKRRRIVWRKHRETDA